MCGHRMSDLYLDGIWVVCVASASVRSRRLETKTCSLCSIGTYTNRHSTCISTLHILFGTPLHHPVEASVSRRVVHHAFATRLGLQSRTQSVSVRIAAIEGTAHCAWHCFADLLLSTGFVLNVPMTLHGRSTVSCATPFLLCVIIFGTRSL